MISHENKGVYLDRKPDLKTPEPVQETGLDRHPTKKYPAARCLLKEHDITHQDILSAIVVPYIIL
jgi:hypothetical protein